MQLEAEISPRWVMCLARHLLQSSSCNREFNSNQPLALSQHAQAAIKNSYQICRQRQRPCRPRRDFAPAGDSLSCLCKKVSKEHSPTVRVPALRYGQTCVTPFRLRCRPTRCAARRFAQTDGGKSVHDATLSCGSVARIPNRVPQAQTHGGVRAACMSCDEAGCWSRPLCQRCPQAKPQGRGQRGRLLLPAFLGEARKAGRHGGPRPAGGA